MKLKYTVSILPMFLIGCGGTTDPIVKILPTPIDIIAMPGYSSDKLEYIDFNNDGANEMVIDWNVRIVTRDGTELSANIFRPSKAGKYPVVMGMTPYNKDDLPVEYEEEDGQIEVSEYAAFELPDPKTWVPSGYVIINIDTRGSNKSEGDINVLTDQESEDYYDSIEWAGEQSWSNGNVGLNGVSYMAINQWKVAALNPPHLKAIMPWEGFTDLYRDGSYHGGIYEEGFIPSWWQYRILANKSEEASALDLPAMVVSNTLDNGFYDQFSSVKQLSSITVPAYITVSWPDHGLHTRGTLIGYEKIASEKKWLEIHGRKKWEWYYSNKAVTRQIAFFDHFLADKKSSILEQSPVMYELRSGYYKGKMLEADSWPLVDLTVTDLYLNATTNNLSSILPEDGSIQYCFNCIRDENELTVQSKAIFTHTFTNDTEITGSMNLELFVSIIDAQDTNLFVGIKKFNTRGNEVYFEGNGVEDGQVANGWLRASHSHLDTTQSTETRPFHSHDKADLFNANEIRKINIEILPSSTVFNAGEQLSIHIQGIDFEESGLEHPSLSSNQGSVKIYTGTNYPSKLIFNTKQILDDQND